MGLLDKIKSGLSSAVSKVKEVATKVTSSVKNVVTKVVETVKDKAGAIVQTVQSVATGNVVGTISGVASIITPTKKSSPSSSSSSNNSTGSTGVIAKINTTANSNNVSVGNKSTWKNRFNEFTKILNK